MPTEPSDNPLVNLLVKLEEAKRKRCRTLGIMAATKLLLDPQWNSRQRQQLEEFKSGEASPVYRGKNISAKYGKDGVYLALRLAMSDAEPELREKEWKESGETLEDWDARQARPFAAYIEKRVKEKIDEDIGRPGRLDTFIYRFFEGGDTKRGAIRRMLDRIVVNGWADELFGDLRECYSIEAVQFGVPEPADDLAEATMKAGSETAGADSADKTKRVPKIEWLARAMLLVREHPDWSDREIARTIKKSHTTLLRSPEFQAAAAMARGEKTDLPQGFKDSKTREIDAYEL